MQNVKFRCAHALSAADQKKKKKKTIMSSTTFTIARYIVPLVVNT